MIHRAIHARFEAWGLALAVLEAANRPDAPGVPGQLRSLIETVGFASRGRRCRADVLPNGADLSHSAMAASPV